jgi:hypothetical protein
MIKTVGFCVACRIALGKLRRVTNIASAVRAGSNFRLVLLANSGPKGVLQSLNPEELALFDHIEDAQPSEMAGRLKSLHVDAAVVDTMRVPDLHQVDALLYLVLREALSEELPKFRLQSERPWDVIILPHPEGHWTPDPGVIAARRIESVGWIYRRPQLSSRENVGSQPAATTVLITTGGGSGEDRGNDIRSDIEYLIQSLRKNLQRPVKFVEVMGPRDWKHHSVESVDEILTPGPELHNLFSNADLVISAAGYNTVLELACTDVPVLLVPVPRYTDDQEKRAQLWGDKLGMHYDSSQKERSVQWMTGILSNRSRRAVIDIGPSGAIRAAEVIRELLAG